MNYHNEVNNLLNNEDIWGMDALSVEWKWKKEILKLDKSMFEKTKEQFKHYEKDDLSRILVVCEDRKKHFISRNLTVSAMVPLSITWVGIAMKQYPSWVELLSFALLFTFLVIAIVKTTFSDTIHDRAINCIQTSIKELLDE